MKKWTWCVSITLIGMLVCAGSALAQDRPAFHNLRFEEDWSQGPYPDSHDFFDPAKKISLSENSWLSVGGEYRLHGEVWSDFGFLDANDDQFMLNRVFLHTDWHLGEHWRIFLEGKFAHSTNRSLPGGIRSALDADEGDFWNTFVEAKTQTEHVEFMFRGGRQELQYGAQRLVSPLDWANNRRIFNGVLFRLKGKEVGWRLDGFVTSPVVIDVIRLNESDDDRLFSGIYFTHPLPENPVAVEVYFLALNSVNNALVNHDRYTIGTRVTGTIIENLTYDVEAAVQVGRLGSLDIFAWMVTAEATYRFAGVSWAPWITLGVDYASGDDDPTDGETNTFNQLFPFGHFYLGFADVVGRANIIDLRLTTGAWPVPKKLRVRIDGHFFWLADEDDGLYTVAGGLFRAPTILARDGTTPIPLDERQVGSEIDFTLLYKINRHWSALFGYSHFFGNAFIDDTEPSNDLDFFYTQLSFQF